MNTITVGDRKFIKYISENEIDKAVEKVAAEVNEEYKNETPESASPAVGYSL